MFHKKKKRKKSLQNNINITKSYINSASSFFSLFDDSSQQSEKNEYFRIQEEEAYQKYLKSKNQLYLYKNNLEKIKAICNLFAFNFLLFLCINNFNLLNIFILKIGCIVYLIFIFSILIKIITVPLKYEERIVLTKQDKEILERREKRKIDEELEQYKKQQKEEVQIQIREKQNEFLGNMAKGIVEAHLSSKNKVYVKGHYRKRSKKR